MPTIAFSNRSGHWSSRYSYAASDFNSINGKFLSCPSDPRTPDDLDGDPVSPVWIHNRGEYNNFYGEQYNSELTVSLNKDASQNKIFKSFSIEGSRSLTGSMTTVRTNNYISSASSTLAVSFIKETGGILYSDLGRENSLIEGKTIITLGQIDFSDGPPVTYTAGNIYGAHPPFYSVKLVQDGNISAQVFHTQSLRMKIGYLRVSNIGGVYFFGSGDLIAPETLRQSTYGQVDGSSLAVYSPPAFNWSPEFSATNPLDGTFNYESNSPALQGLLNSQSPTNIETFDYYLIGIAHPSLAGDTPRGTHAESTVIIPPSAGYFELSAVNLNYEPLRLDHHK